MDPPELLEGTEELLTEAVELLLPEREDELLLPETEELLTEATELLERAEELLLPETTELLEDADELLLDTLSADEEEGVFPSEDELGVSPLEEELGPAALPSDDDETSATARDELDGSPPSSLLSDEQERVNIVASTTPAVNQTNLTLFIKNTPFLRCFILLK